MRVYLDCWPCFLRQALSAARPGRGPARAAAAIPEETMTELRALSADATQVLALMPALRARVKTAAGPLQTAVRIAITGTIIDYGVAETFDLGQHWSGRCMPKPRSMICPPSVGARG